jgi:hypothetical protein
MDQVVDRTGARTMPDKVMSQLFGIAENPVWLCSLPNDKEDSSEPGERHLATRDSGEVAKFIAKWNRAKRGLFFCVSTIQHGAKRNKENVAEICFLHADIDFKDVKETPDSILKRLKTLPLPPSLIVSSGHGYHVYWCFKEAIAINIVDGAETVERIEAALKLLADLVGGDQKVTQVAALMRVPGTHNTKFGEWNEVMVIEANDNRYDLDDIDTMLWECAPIVLRKIVPPRTAGEDNPYLAAAKALGFKPPIDVEKRLAGMVYMGGDDAAIHDTQISVTASLLNAGVEVEEAVSLVLEATRAAAADYGNRWNWRREETELRKACVTWIKKHPQPKPTADATGGAGAADGVGGGPQAAPRSKKPAGGNSDALHLTISNVFFDAMERRGYDFRMVPDSRGVEQCWRYDGDLWSLVNDVTVYLNRELEAVICGMQIENMSANKVITEARCHILRSANLISKERIAFDSHGMVAIKGFLIDPLTLQLVPMRKDHYCTGYLAVEYDATAVCPWWCQALLDMFADRADLTRDKLIGLIQEMLGVALLDDKKKALTKGLILVGDSNSGKSTALDVLSGLLTDEPIATSMDAINGPHGLMDFLRRAPWVLHEAFDGGKWHPSSKYKSIISGDPVDINVKNGPMISKRLKPPIFHGSNLPVQIREPTNAVRNRLIIINCMQEFKEDELIGAGAEAAKRNYEKPSLLILKHEKPGLLNWALAGMQRALKRGHFERIGEIEETLEEFRIESNLAASFLKEHCTYGPDNRIRVEDFCAAFSTHWVQNKSSDQPVPGNDAIIKNVKLFGDKRVATGLRDNRYRYLCGPHLTKTGLEYWDVAVKADRMSGHMASRIAQTSTEKLQVNGHVPTAWNTKDAIQRLRRADFTTKQNEGDDEGDEQQQSKPKPKF